MAQIPAVCFECGITFSSGFDITGGPATVQRNQAQCPQCRKRVPILDGVYSEHAGKLSVRGASRFTTLQVERLNQLRQTLLVQRSLTSDVIDALEAIDPDLGRIAKKVRERKWSALFIAAMISFALKSCVTSDGPAVNIHIGPTVVNTTNITTENSVLDRPNDSQKQKPGHNAQSPADRTKHENDWR